jgi:hypothetical protein
MKYLIPIVGIVILGTILLILNYTIKEKYSIYDPFRKSLNTLNRLVRKNTWTYYNTDTNIKNWIISLINEKNCKKLFISTNLYYGHSDLEFNYSHTMADKVILSNHDYNSLKQFYKEKDMNAVYSIGSLIVHESVHVDQRYNYDKYIELYKLWGYEFVNDIQNIDKLLEIKRQNPDANDDNILWNDGNDNYYFINCFFDKNNPSTRITKYAFPIQKINNIFIYYGNNGILLDELYSYTNFFGNIDNNYTPNEITAEYTEIIFGECLQLSPLLFDSDAYNIFKKHFNY